jgi:hypothetical protein
MLSKDDEVSRATIVKKNSDLRWTIIIVAAIVGAIIPILATNFVKIGGMNFCSSNDGGICTPFMILFVIIFWMIVAVSFPIFYVVKNMPWHGFLASQFSSQTADLISYSLTGAIYLGLISWFLTKPKTSK